MAFVFQFIVAYIGGYCEFWAGRAAGGYISDCAIGGFTYGLVVYGCAGGAGGGGV